MSEPEKSSNEASAKAVQQLLETMQSRFQTLSESILERIDALGCRIDDLENSVAKLSKKQENSGKKVREDSPVPRQEQAE